MTDCVILAGADMDTSLFNISDFEGKYVICADKGVCHAKTLGISPDLIVGDFDSLGYIPEAVCKIEQYKTEKDDTDLMIALKKAILLGYTDIAIYAALGGRLDHTVASIQSLSYALDNGVKARLVSETEIVELLEAGEYSFEHKEGFSLSLFSYGESVEGLSIKGCKYNVSEITINNSFPIGISNEIIDCSAVVSFKNGRLLVVRSSLVTTC